MGDVVVGGVVGTTAVTVAVLNDELPARSNACTAMKCVPAPSVVTFTDVAGEFTNTTSALLRVTR